MLPPSNVLTADLLGMAYGMRLLQALCNILEQVPLVLPGKKLKQLVGSDVKSMQDAVRQLQQTLPVKKVSCWLKRL